MVTDQTLRTKGLGSRLREADLTFLVMSSAVSARPPPPELGSVSSPPGVHLRAWNHSGSQYGARVEARKGELGRCAGC